MVSRKALEAAFPGKGQDLRALLTGQMDPESLPRVAMWIAKCYHRPRRQDLIEAGVDAILEGYGTEAIWGENPTQPVASYINLGDTYTTTLLYNYRTQAWLVTSWGDFVERNARRYHIA